MGRSERVKKNSKKIVTGSENSVVKKDPELIDLAWSRPGVAEIITLDSINCEKRNLSKTCEVIDLEDDMPVLTVLATHTGGEKWKNSARNSLNKEICIEEDDIHPDPAGNLKSGRELTNEMRIVGVERELCDRRILASPKNTNVSFPESKCLAVLGACSVASVDERPDSIMDSLSQCLVPNPSSIPVAENSLSLMDPESGIKPSQTQTLSQPSISGHPSPNFLPYKRSFALPGLEEINRIKTEHSALASLSNNPSTKPCVILGNLGSSSSVTKGKSSVKPSPNTVANTNDRYALRSRGPPLPVSRKSIAKKRQNKKLVLSQVAGKNKHKFLTTTSAVSRYSSSAFQSNSVNIESNNEESDGIKAVVCDSLSVSAVRRNSAGGSNIKPQPEFRASLTKEKRGKMCPERGSSDQELDFIPIPHPPRHIQRELSQIFKENKKNGALRAQKRVRNPKTKWPVSEKAPLNEIEYSNESEFSSELCAPKSRRQIKKLRRKIVRAQARKMTREQRKKKAVEERGKPPSKKLKGLKASREINRLRQHLNNIQSTKIFGKNQRLEPAHLKNLSAKEGSKLKRKLRHQEIEQKLRPQLNKLNKRGKWEKQKPIGPKRRKMKKCEKGIEDKKLYHSTPLEKKPKRWSESRMNLSRSFSDFNWITLDACQTDFDDGSSEASNQDFDGSDFARPSSSKFLTPGVSKRSHSRLSRLSRHRSESEESCQEVPLSVETMRDNDVILIDDGEKLSSDDAEKLSSDDGISDGPIADDLISLSSEESFPKQAVAHDAESLSSEESFSIDIGTNVFVPGGVSFKGRRPIIIDGSNVAIAHGLSTRGKRVFSSRGLEICAKFFTKRGHKVIVFVPLFRRCDPKTLNPEILQRMSNKGLMTYTPSRKLKNRLSVPYDDRYIVQCAVALGGVIVSTDNYKDLLKENRTWKSTIEKRLLMFTFVGDMLMFPQDPLGRRGPKLDDFLMFPR